MLIISHALLTDAKENLLLESALAIGIDPLLKQCLEVAGDMVLEDS
jgi:hypothetical protein